VVKSNGGRQIVEERILKAGHSREYLTTTLCKNKIPKTHLTHTLVAIAFLNHIPCGHFLIVNHKDGNKKKNYVSNIEVVTSRENLSTCYRADRYSKTSIYTGVSWHKRDGVWQSYITMNKKRRYLGSFVSEQDASNAYQKALLYVNAGTFEMYYESIKPKRSSEYKGVSWNKLAKKWKAAICLNGKEKYLGYFKTEIDANLAVQKCLDFYV
jgi:hypothetical protein